MDSTMEKTLSSQAPNWREGMRLRAFELKKRSWKQTEIADPLGVTEGTVSQWMKRAREQGVEGLRHKSPPGATPRLSDSERARRARLPSARPPKPSVPGPDCRSVPEQEPVVLLRGGLR